MINKLSKFPFSSLKRSAVILAGSGVADGSEITEAVSLLISLTKLKSEIQCFSLDKNQADVLNHVTGKSMSENRNVLIESARIARGNVKSITEFNPSEFSAVFLPGGFGAAKNWSNFAFAGNDFKVFPDIEILIRKSIESKIPIGACCISPLLLAKVLGKEKVRLTLGKSSGTEWPNGGVIVLAKELGAECEEKDVNEVSIDERLKVFTTPAFMKGSASFFDVFNGIDQLVIKVDEFLKNKI